MGTEFRRDALKIQERNLAEDGAGREKSNLQYVVGVSIMSEKTTLSLSLYLSLLSLSSLSPLPLSLIGQCLLRRR